MSTVLVLDVGGQSVRAALVNDHGVIADLAQMPVTTFSPVPGQVEQDAEEILDACRVTLDAILDRNARPQSAALCCQRSSVLAWKNQTPLSPVLSWQDLRGAAQIEGLHKKAAAVYEHTGLPLNPHYAASKLHYLSRLFTDAHLGPLASFILQGLGISQDNVCDHTQAQRSQLFNIQTLHWDETLCQWFDVSSRHLPSLRPSLSHFGHYRDIPWELSLGDQNAASCHPALNQEDQGLLNLGTGGFILTRSSISAPPLIQTLQYSSPSQVHFVTEGTINGCASAFASLGIADWQNKLELVSELIPEGFYLNTGAGSGSPWWITRQNARFTHVPADETTALAAVAESIGFHLKANLDCLPHKPAQLMVSGGLANNSAFMQLLADISQIPLRSFSQRELTLLGAASLLHNTTDWQLDSQQLFTPQPQFARTKRYKEYKEILDASGKP